ncbi:MAG: hypothetical protein JKY48_14600 [Flavobacteriales bacterium]|nr:hypothetical protein [Flavobacteriales bacterium]
MQQLISSYKLTGVLFFFCLFCSCGVKNDKNSFDREDMIQRFLLDETTIGNLNEFTLILINASDCGACNIKDIRKIQESLLYDKNRKTFFVFTTEKTDLLKEVIDKDAKIIYTDLDLLERYGLRFFSPYIFHIVQNKIIQWDKVESD